MFASKIARSATLSLAVAAVISSIAVPATAGVTIFGGSEDKQQVQLPDFVKLVEDNGPGVVNIQMIRNARTVENAGIPGLDPRGAEIFRRFGIPFDFGPQEIPEQRGTGSGFIVSSDGIIMTNAHVVEGADELIVRLTDKREFKGKVLGSDKQTDIAVIKIDADGLTPAIVGDSDKLAVGDNVLAVGNPLGELGGTVTSGIVSALNRSVSIQSSSSVNTMSLIQMDASVSPGNSGGGLFNMNGELIGIVNAKSSSSDAEGLGFAIPINDAIKVAQDLLENGYVTGRPYMGITYLAVNDAQTAAQLGVNAYGIYVVDVVSGGPADKAGLKAGDRIVSIDNTEVAQKTDLGTLMQEHSAGDTLSITVARDGQMQTVSLTLGEKNAANSGNGTNGASRQEKSAESAPQQNPQG